MNPIPYGRQEITQQDINAVVQALTSDFLTQGPAIAQFEKNFSGYVGSRYAVAISNGTAALHLAVMALGLKPGEKVITTPITFAASANCVLYCGGEVVFADIDKDSYLIDLNKVRELLEKDKKIKGIIPVDFAGNPVHMYKLRKLADEFGCWIIEDACHAPGAYYTDDTGKQHLCGNGQYSDVTVFSFHPVKHIATGEGGMITTNNVEVYDKLMMLRTHGITKDAAKLNENHGGWYHEMQTLGYNYRITDIQAALGVSQLTRAEEGMKKREAIAKRYSEVFKDSAYKIPAAIEKGNRHAFHLYVIQTEDRLGLYDYLKTKEIYAQVHYLPVHLHPYYQARGFKKGDFPVAESYYNKCLSLPMFPSLKKEEHEYVIEHVLQFEKKRKLVL